MCRLFLGMCIVLLGLFAGALWEVSGSHSPLFSAPMKAVASSSVVGAPSVSVAFINRVLLAYHSPAAGLGQALYEDGVAAQIDPVYTLAFFMHESSFGRLGWGHANHSLGNIRCSAGYACQGGYRFYRSWQEGCVDWYRLIRGRYVDQLGLSTVEQIVPVYAPAADHNDVEAYIQAIEKAVATWRSGRLLVLEGKWQAVRGEGVMVWGSIAGFTQTIGKNWPGSVRNERAGGVSTAE
jgi:hypothetical protein